ELARAPGAASQPTALISGLGGALVADGHRQEAWALLHAAQQRHPGDFWINYLLGHFLEQERPQEAVGYFRAAIAVRPGSNQAYARLSQALRAAGDADGALDAMHESVALHLNREGMGELAKLL